jgi:hypothetical protein
LNLYIKQRGKKDFTLKEKRYAKGQRTNKETNDEGLTNTQSTRKGYSQRGCENRDKKQTDIIQT